jgi:hypothetical protein
MVFQLFPLLIQLLVGIALQAVGYLLMPQAKSQRTEDVTDMDAPTAEGGRPIPVVFGEIEVTGVNIIFYSDKETTSREVDA